MRVVAFVPPGTNARSIYLDLVRGLQRAGHDVFLEDVGQFLGEHSARLRASGGAPDDAMRASQASYARHVEHLIESLGPDAVLTLWVEPLMAMPWLERDGRPASVMERCEIPMKHFWLDAPFWAYEGRLVRALGNGLLCAPAHEHIVNNPGTADEMSRILGFSSVDALAYGYCDCSFYQWPDIERDLDLVINAGGGDPPPTSLMLEQIETDEPDIAAIRADEARRAERTLTDLLRASGSAPLEHAAAMLAERWVNAQLSDPDRPMLEKLGVATSELGIGDEQYLNCFARSPQLWADATAMVRRVDAWQRVFTSVYLSRRVTTVVVGSASENWRRQGWPIACPCSGSVQYHELALLYSRAKIGLNVMRYQDDVGLNPKALEIAACGCVPLVRWRVGLEETLESDAHCRTFSSPCEALTLARELLSDASRTAAIGEAAAAHVRDHHTWAHRADVLLDTKESATMAA